MVGHSLESLHKWQAMFQRRQVATWSATERKQSGRMVAGSHTIFASWSDNCSLFTNSFQFNPIGDCACQWSTVLPPTKISNCYIIVLLRKEKKRKIEKQSKWRQPAYLHTHLEIQLISQTPPRGVPWWNYCKIHPSHPKQKTMHTEMEEGIGWNFSLLNFVISLTSYWRGMEFKNFKSMDQSQYY